MSGADDAPGPASAEVAGIPAAVEDLTETALPQPAGLPIPRLPRPFRTRTAHYFVVTVDRRGRLSSRLPARMLGWLAGHRIDIAADPAVIAVVSDPEGRDTITEQGHLRLPSNVRRTCRLKSVDRLLVAIYPQSDLLVAYPMPAVDTMVTAYDSSLDGDTPP